MQRATEQLPGLLTCALMANRDECPPETCMYLCRLEDTQECDCMRCWENYLIYVGGGRRGDPYACERRRDE